MSSYGFLNDEAQGANRVSGRRDRQLLHDSGNADYGNDRASSFAGEEDDFLRQAPASSQAQDNSAWQVTGIDRVLNVDQGPDGEDRFNANWMANNFTGKGTRPPGYQQGRDDQPFGLEPADDMPLMGQMLDAENDRPIRGQQAAAAPAAPPPKKRGFFKKLWSAIRGRGWR